MNVLTKTGLSIFCLAFLLIVFLSADVPPHWESHLFIEGAFSRDLLEVLWTTVRLGDEVPTASHGPVNVFYYRILFFLFGYNFFLYRLIKSLFFAGAMVFFFRLALFFLEMRYAVMASAFFMFSFPLFIQTFVFDEGFIIGEFFKMTALFFFFNSLVNSSIKKKFLFFIFALLAIRMYTPTFSIIGVVLGYLIFFERKKIKQYAIPLLLLFFLKFPIGSSGLGFGDSNYGFKFIIVKKIFFENAWRFIFSPFPYFSDLYYRPYVSILTFFGVWLFIVLFIICMFGRKLSKYLPNIFNYFNKVIIDKKLGIFLIWIVCEIPILFVLPEHAIRYTAALTAPVALLFFYFFQNAQLQIKKSSIKNIMFIFFILMLFTNVAYASLFRATWGSAFIGMEKSSMLIRDIISDGKNAKVFYYATSAAPEYHIVEKNETDKYTVSKRIVPIVMNINEISPAFFNNQRDNIHEIFIIKRISSFGNSEFPMLNFEEYVNLKRIAIVEGRTKGFFDILVGNVLSFLNYKPNQFFIYQVLP